MRTPVERLVLPLDVPTLAEAREWLDRLGGEVGVFKVGLQLFTAEGPAAVDAVRESGADCFLDLKLHDIPATMAKAAAAAATLGVRYLTVHTAAGPAALQAVADAVKGSGTELLGVTVLTSMDADQLAATGVGEGVADLVVRRGRLAVTHGLGGLVCSPHECLALRSALKDVTLMVPGIRPASAAQDDQRRRATPTEAIQAGADLLVVGRPIRNADDPVAAAQAIVAEIEAC